MSRSRRTAIFGVASLVFASGLLAVEVQVVGTHNAKFNLDGQVIGEFRDHTPLRLENVSTGKHKLYVKSLITGELLLFQFDARYSDTPEFAANFAPPRDDANAKARRRTGLVVALTASEILGNSSTGRQDRRAIVGGAALVNELIPGQRHDRDYSRQYGNTIEVKAQVDLDINLDNTGSKLYEMSDAKRFHHLAAGWHKLYVRNRKTRELRVFKIEFPEEGTRTVTTRPEFAPPRGETVNAKARRRTAVLGALLANEFLGDGGTGRGDRRKVLAGAGVVNEVIGTNAGRRREEVVLNMKALPYPLPTID